MKDQLKKWLFRMLSENDDLLLRLQNASLESLWIWNVHDRNDFWVSPGYYTMLSFPECVESTERLSLSELVFEPDLEKVQAAIQHHISRGTACYNVVIRMKNYHGKLGWYRTRGVFVGKGPDQAHYIIGTTTPLSSPEKMEPIFRKTLEASSEAIYVLAAHYSEYEVTDFIIRDINQKAEKELSMSRSDLIGQRINELFPINLEKGYFERYKQAYLSGKTVSGDYTIPADYPGTGKYQNNIVPYDDGVIIYNRDLTKLRETEGALAQAKETINELDLQYQDVVSTQSVYVLKTNMQGDFTYINDYFLSQFGFTREELIGTNSMESVFKQDHKACLQTVQKCISTPNVYFPVVLKKLAQDGRLLSGKWEFKCLLNGQGEPAAILCVGFDITEQVQALERAEELLQVTTDRNNRLRSFAYIVSHNIRSHSSNIQGLSELLTGEDDSTDREYLDMLKYSANMLDRTISHLSEILTIQWSTNQLKREINLLDEINNTLSLFKKDIKNFGIKVKLEVPADFTVRFVASYLESVLLNLISNAIKYRSPDRGLIIELFAGQHERKPYFGVTDNGTGLDLEKVGEDLFGMYKTFHGNPDARGFGLFLARAQVEAMGGRIETKSTVNEGTSFTIWLNE